MNMQHTIRTMAAGLLLLGLLVGCSQPKEAEKAATSKPPVAVETATAQPSELVEGIEVTGSLAPKFFAEVKSQIPGLIREVYVTEWVRVAKGTPLARIDVSESEARVKQAEANLEAAKADLAQARVVANRAERELARARELKAAGLATRQAVDDAESEAAAAQARVAAATARIGLSEEELRQARTHAAKGEINAPMSGVVALRDVNVGDLASDAGSAKSLFRIVDNRILNLTVTVPSSASARVKVGQPLEFTVDAQPGTVFAGTVKFINPELNSSDRSLMVVAEINNAAELLKGGLFAKGRIVTNRRVGALLIPRGALINWDMAGGRAGLFVLTTNQAHLRPVETGAINGEQVEIVKGLAAGEKYVLRGGFTLKDGDKTTNIEQQNKEPQNNEVKKP
ncbi:MAG: efflux RND transporter periplasmic adaptor subunit [Desulfobulbaceae bacterium]|nr:efflux RND transporter periplasmic adaptor subunit [Desulfobulbaceae bacterium]